MRCPLVSATERQHCPVQEKCVPFSVNCVVIFRRLFENFDLKYLEYSSGSDSPFHLPSEDLDPSMPTALF